MIIPEHVNFIQFYIAAKAKGIKIKSRYRGVSAHYFVSSDITWRMQFRVKNKQVVKYFPFNAQGEKAASQAYEELKNSL